MKTGLVLGKFLPLHNGHLALVNFARQHCDKLIILVCSTRNEPIDGKTRYEWLNTTLGHNTRVVIRHIEYNDDKLPNTSVSSPEVSRLWADYIGEILPEIDIFFSSEPYGEFVARHLNIEHIMFDPERKQVNISASEILQNPFGKWDFIAKAAQPYFVKKICVAGSESTGKSTLSCKLAEYFQTAFVPEMAREIIETTATVEYEHLGHIAELHARTINEKIKEANKILICDTDVNITCSYAKYLFNKPLNVPEWIYKANHFDMHLFLETDCLYIQDGTRLPEKERNALSNYHKSQLQEAGIDFYTITGTWEERFEKTKALIIETFFTQA